MAQESKITVEGVAVKLLRSGKSAKETLEAVRRVFPQAQTSIKCIYFYSSKHKVGLQRSQVVDLEALKAVMGEIEPKATVLPKTPEINKVNMQGVANNLKPTGTSGK